MQKYFSHVVECPDLNSSSAQVIDDFLPHRNEVNYAIHNSGSSSLCCLAVRRELCMSLTIDFSVRRPWCCPRRSLPVGGEDLIDRGVFLLTGEEDGRVTEGVLFRGTHSLALEAVNKCKSWRLERKQGREEEGR